MRLLELTALGTLDRLDFLWFHWSRGSKRHGLTTSDAIGLQSRKDTRTAVQHEHHPNHD